MKNIVRVGFSLLAAAGLSDTARALTFNFIYAPGTSTDAIAGFEAAGQRWASIFDDPIVVNINIAFAPLGGGILGQASSTQYIWTYDDYRFNLGLDQTSAADAVAVANLPSGFFLNADMNYTTQNGGSPTPYTDSNNSLNNFILRSTSAELKAMGVAVAPSTDADIKFSSSFNFDFDPTDGITAGHYDFVGIATHEIGHAMGFVSGIDSRDWVTQNLGVKSENESGLEAWVMDIFRFSDPGTRDWTLGIENKYFSIDNGATSIAPFSTGVYFGDGRQASHWKDGLGIGIMDPTAAIGELLAISPNDVLMMDIIGWDLASEVGSPVPEAGTLVAGFAFAGLGLLEARRRRRA